MDRLLSAVRELSLKPLEKRLMKRNEIIRTLSGFVDSNRDKYEIIRIGVFGSAARDNMDEQSDIDVVVELGKPNLFYLVGIKQDLEEKFHRPLAFIYRSMSRKALTGRNMEPGFWKIFPPSWPEPAWMEWLLDLYAYIDSSTLHIHRFGRHCLPNHFPIQMQSTRKRSLKYRYNLVYPPQN
jgi:uncharacterized protein